MQEKSTNFNKTFYESTSTEDDCKCNLLNVNPVHCQTHQSKSRYPPWNIRSRRKLLKKKLLVQHSSRSTCSSSFVEEEIYPTQNEHKIISTEKAEYSSDGGAIQSIIRTKRKLRERRGTPRIVQAIGRHSGTLSVKHKEISLSPPCLGEIKTKCSVTVLCESDKSHHFDGQLSSISPRNFIRISKSEQTFFTTSPRLNRKNESVRYCPRLFPLYRRQSHPLQAKKHIAADFDIVRELQKSQECKPGFKNMTKKLAVTSHFPKQIENNIKQIFPFKSTPSGNLKIIPNQVTFESRKVSVLIADPEHIKVDVKTEINKLGMQYNDGELDEDYPRIKQQQGDLPLSVTPLSIDQLHAQQKFPRIETSCVSETQPHMIEHPHKEMEHQQEVCNQRPTFQQLPLANEIPLSSLGFNREKLIVWDNIKLPEKTDLYSHLANRIINYKNADFTVKIGIDEFHCHLLVLQSYSTFFDEQNCKEIELTRSGVTSKAFVTIYEWMISATDKICHFFRRDNILEILMGAQYLGIKELEEQCWALINNNELFFEDTAFLLYLEAKEKGNTTVMELMVPRIMKFFLLLVSTKDFLELSVDEVCSLLRSNHISVNSEMEVLMSAVRWLMYDWGDRKQYMLDVLKCIRFGLIAPWQLVDVKRNPKNPEFMELMVFEDVRRMVDDGLAFVIIKHWYGDRTEDYYHWINLLDLTEPTNRNWTGEDKNYITYQEFRHYLDEYQRTIMPELKVRKSTSMSSNQQQYSELQQSNGTDSNYEVSVTTDNAMRVPSAFPNATVESSSSPHTPPSANTPSASTHIKMSRGSFTEYLSNHNSNFTTGACGDRVDNGEVKINDASIHHHTGLNPTLNIFRRNEHDNNCKQHTIVANDMHCNHQLEPNIIISHGKHLHNVRSMLAQSGNYKNSLISENNAAIRIQAYYRGYKTRRKLKRILSDINKRNEKNFELFPVSTNSDEILKLSKFTQTANTCDVKNVKRKYRPGNSRQKQIISSSNWMNFDENKHASKDLNNAPLDVKKFDQMYTQKDSEPGDKSNEQNISISQLAQRKSLHMKKSTTLLYNFNGQISSATSFDNNTNTDEPLSPTIRLSTSNKYKNFVRPKSEPEERISINKIERVDNYFPDYSLFHSENEAVLVLGGIDLHTEYGANNNTGKDIYRYMANENIWEFVGEIPEPRHHHSAIYFNGRVYLVGGADPRQDQYRAKSYVVGTVWSYDPTRRQWFNEPELLTPRQNFSLVVIQEKIFVIGGQDKNGFALRSVEAFDPSEYKWIKIQPMNTARVGAACANFQDFIWVAGGIGKSEILKEVECYDPVKNMWHKIEPLRIPRCFATLYTTSNCLYLIGGVEKVSACVNMTASIKAIDIWDCNLRNWRQLTEMSIARHKHSVGAIGNKLLIIGGVSTVYMKTLKSIECFCHERSTWIKGVASLPYAISGHDSVSLPFLNKFENF